jgi:hypothetical protein
MKAFIHTRDYTSDLIPKAALAATRLSISDTKRAMSRPIAISSSLKSRFDQIHRDKLDIDMVCSREILRINPIQMRATQCMWGTTQVMNMDDKSDRNKK